MREQNSRVEALDSAEEQSESGGDEAMLEQMLTALCNDLVKSRSEAIEKRSGSGIEYQWDEDEEFYEGIDDANRGEMTAWTGKPLGTPGIKVESSTGSTVFANITRPYCDAASARASDMLLPVDDKAWSIKPTPLPNLDLLATGDVPEEISTEISAYILETMPDAPEGEQQDAVAMETNRIIEQAQAIVKKAADTAERAEKRIMDWQVEGQYHSEVRLVIEDAARIGTGILKGPFPEKRRSIAYKRGELLVDERIIPVSRRIDYRNFFPDPGCGESIHDGAYTWERDDITVKKLRELIGVPGYLSRQIEQVIAEGPQRVGKITDMTDLTSCLQARDTDHLFEIWYYCGSMTRKELKSILSFATPHEDPEEGYNEEIELGDDTEVLGVQVSMINNQLIKANITPLDTEDFPYDAMVWQKRRGMPWGIGVARQIREPQRIVVAAIRSMMDNAGRAAGGQIIFDPEYIEPATGSEYSLKPWGAWKLIKSIDQQKSINEVFSIVTIDMQQVPLQNIVNMAMRLAEDVTGLPVIMQGQTNSATPQTLGGMQMQNNNASTVLRRIARLFDDLVTEPHTRRYYTYLLQYGPSDDEKGDFQIDARGSSALMEREIQNQQIIEMGQLVQNPIYGVDPKKWVREYFKSQRLDYNSYEYDDEEWQAIVEKMMQPDADPRMQIAQMNAEMRTSIEQMKEQNRMQIEQLHMKDREDERAHDADQKERDRQIKLMVTQMTEDIQAMQMGSKKSINLDTIKASLAEVAAKLQTQRELSAASRGETISASTAPTEPAGRAENGMAYEQ